MAESENGASLEGRCQAKNARGERCGKRAAHGRLCLVHAGVQNMRELGRKGGSVRPMTRLRETADDDLREQARSTLARAMAGEDVPKSALDAARSLFSYGATQAPRDDDPSSREAGEPRPVSLLGTLRVLASLGAVDPAGIRQLADSIESPTVNDVEAEAASTPKRGEQSREATLPVQRGVPAADGRSPGASRATPPLLHLPSSENSENGDAA